MPALGAGALLESLDDGAIDSYVELAGPDVDVPLIFLEIRRLGGALGRSSDDHGALDVAGAQYLLYGLGPMMSPEMGAAVRGALGGVMGRWRRGRPTTACSPSPTAPGSAKLLPAPVADRLERIKSDYDPDALILANHRD